MNLDKLIETQPTWKVFLIFTLVTSLFCFGLLNLMDYFLPIGEKVSETRWLVGKIVLSLFMGVMMGGLISTSSSYIKAMNKFFEVAKPLKERADVVKTKTEWSAIVNEINDFYHNNEYGKMNNDYLNRINSTLKAKKEFMI